MCQTERLQSADHADILAELGFSTRADFAVSLGEQGLVAHDDGFEAKIDMVIGR